MARQQTENAQRLTPPAAPLSNGVRYVLSALIIWHVLAIFVPPFTFTTSGMRPTEGSPVALQLMSIFRPYVDFTFLNHGYAFFAPDPGPSHLVRAHLEYGDGRPGNDVIFPNLKEQWPRLLYHRHFMLSEQLNTRFVPPNAPPDFLPDSPQYRSWKHARDTYDAMWQSFAKHLTTAHAAESAVLTRIEHRQPVPDEFEQNKMKIDDPRLYVDLPETSVPVRAGGRP